MRNTWPFKTRVTHARPVLVVSEDEPQNDALYEPIIECTCKAADMPFGRCCKADKPASAVMSQLLGETR